MTDNTKKKQLYAEAYGMGDVKIGIQITGEYPNTPVDTSPPVLGAFPTRKVLENVPHPSDNKRRMYLLECGHTVDRPSNYRKKVAVCTFCSRRKHSRV